MKDADPSHYRKVVAELAEGLLIPFLGAGANLCDLPRGSGWARNDDPKDERFLPSGAELASYLAFKSEYPRATDPKLDLEQVSDYVVGDNSEAVLYRYLREVFESKPAPTSLHVLLARVAMALKLANKPHLLVVTTNYDDLIERAFGEEGLEFDVVWYDARTNSPSKGQFLHRAPGTDATPIPRTTALGEPSLYLGLPDPLERPAILKLHGCFDRGSAAPDGDSYVITQGSYIDYLADGDVGAAIPIVLRDRIATSSMLFLGYALNDWNLRVILDRIWRARMTQVGHWSVHRKPDNQADLEIETVLEEQRKTDDRIDGVYAELKDYVTGLDTQLQASLPSYAASKQA